MSGDFGSRLLPRLLLRCVGNLRPRFLPGDFFLPLRAEKPWPPPTPKPPSGPSSGFPTPLPAPPVFLPAGAAGSVAGLPAVGSGAAAGWGAVAASEVGRVSVLAAIAVAEGAAPASHLWPADNLCTGGRPDRGLAAGATMYSTMVLGPPFLDTLLLDFLGRCSPGALDSRPLGCPLVR